MSRHRDWSATVPRVSSRFAYLDDGGNLWRVGYGPFGSVSRIEYGLPSRAVAAGELFDRHDN
ncbi:hypothetical protein [Mycolicibacterium sphagni]|uniref:hypothetical protein n=1 Tax=Mycolicibacterium sphagni TaxID=1786 RepID=UPI0021F3BAEB|nr:hypothetical protein [Mycolicibacterium sphagni]MCV7174845.1 hypothetical protein [Mycolicibacterium sphagni]